jgi:hypothetical protein
MHQPGILYGIPTPIVGQGKVTAVLLKAGAEFIRFQAVR